MTWTCCLGINALRAAVAAQAGLLSQAHMWGSACSLQRLPAAVAWCIYANAQKTALACSAWWAAGLTIVCLTHCQQGQAMQVQHTGRVWSPQGPCLSSALASVLLMQGPPVESKNMLCTSNSKGSSCSASGFQQGPQVYQTSSTRLPWQLLCDRLLSVRPAAAGPQPECADIAGGGC
jgi:hypothetical protein